MNILQSFLQFFQTPMTQYIVVYNCARGYRSFRSVRAYNPEEAVDTVIRNTYNFGDLREVLIYEGE